MRDVHFLGRSPALSLTRSAETARGPTRESVEGMRDDTATSRRPASSAEWTPDEEGISLAPATWERPESLALALASHLHWRKQKKADGPGSPTVWPQGRITPWRR